jgi:hydroxymethylpyrimidine/phosphomethylpyrimidine kinase
MTDQLRIRPVVLTIAGLDPSGGAGIVADIKTISAFGCAPAAAVTSITFQNTVGVYGAEHQTVATLRGQVEPILTNVPVAAAKTGMLPTAEIVAEVARLFTETNLPAPVIDPVMISTSGYDLIDTDAFEVLKTRLLKVARIVTPNIPEAERLAGLAINTRADIRRAAEAIKELGAAAVLVTGGHRLDDSRNEAIDVLLNQFGQVTEFREEFVHVGEVHGSGCTLSAAIASCLGLGMTLEEAVKEAKRYVTNLIRTLKQLPPVGQEARPL